MAQNLQVKLTLNAAEFDKAVKEAKDGVLELGKGAEQGGIGFGKLAAAFALGEIAATAFKKALGFVADQVTIGIHNAIEAEQAETRLAQAFASRGLLTAQTMASSRALADEMARLTKFTDEEFLASQKLLVGIGGLGEEALPAASRAAADLAAFMGKDLNEATLLVAKAAAGNEEALGRIGIKLREGIPEGEKFAEVMRLVSEKMGGAAQAEVSTFGGQIGQLTKAWGELLEAIGTFITESPGLRALIEALTNIFTMWTAQLKASKDGTDALEGSMAVLMPVLRATLAILAGLASAFHIVMIGMNGLAEVAVLIGTGWTHIFTLGKFAAEAIGIAWSNASAIIKTVWLKAQETILIGMAAVAEKAAGVAGIFNEDLRLSLINFTNSAREAVNGVRRELEVLPDVGQEIGEKWEQAKRDIAETHKVAADTIRELDKNVDQHIEGIGGVADAYVRADEALAGVQRRSQEIAAMPFGPKNKEAEVIARPTAGPMVSLPKGPEEPFNTANWMRAFEIGRQGNENLTASMDLFRDKSKEGFREDEEGRKAWLETQLQAHKDFLASHEGMILVAQEQRAADRAQRAIEAEAEATENQGFILALAEQFNATGQTAVDATLTMRDAMVDAFGQIEGAVSSAIFAAVTGAGNIQAVWTNLANSLLKTVIDALVRIAAQFIINSIIGKAVGSQLAAQEIGNNLARVFSGSFAATAGIPIIGPALAPGVAAASLAAATAGTTGAKTAGAGIGAFAEGSDFIPETGGALLHRGERIVPATTNNDLSEFLRRQERGGEAGGLTIQINVGEFIGEQDRIDRLAEAVAEAVALRNVRSN